MRIRPGTEGHVKKMGLSSRVDVRTKSSGKRDCVLQEIHFISQLSGLQQNYGWSFAWLVEVLVVFTGHSKVVLCGDTSYRVCGFICGVCFPVSILHKSIAGRYRPVKVADGPITARCRFIKNASWVSLYLFLKSPLFGPSVGWGCCASWLLHFLGIFTYIFV